MRGLPLLLLACALCLAARSPAATFTEDFSTPPAARDWRAFGDASLFAWHSTNQNLEVTWDSSRDNSYFFRPLGTILTKSDDFALQFDLRLRDIQGGANPERPCTFPIAVGFLRLASATNAAFLRGTGRNSPHLVEWTYFPAADGIEATVSPLIVSDISRFIPGFAFPLEMPVEDLFRITMSYTASNKTLVTTMTRNGAAFSSIPNVTLPGSFTDFRVDAVSINSYNDASDACGSVLARGIMDNLSVTTPAPPIANLTARVTNGVYRIQFAGRTNWNYTLERGADLQAFTPIQTVNLPVTTNIVLQEMFVPGVNRFYRIRADRP